jgi:hypothetical protein
MTRAEEDALLSDLAEAERHVRLYVDGKPLPREWAYLAKLLRHALQIVEPKKEHEDLSRGQSVPGVGHGDLPRRKTGDD